MLERERLSQPKEPRHFVRRPPYLAELLSKPYPEKYETPTFSLYDGRKGNAIEHVNKFLDSIGPFVGNVDLCLREFSKSLTDRAYTWYSTYSQVSLPHRMTWLKVSVQSIFMGRKRLPSSLFSILSKSPLKDSLISSGDSEMLLLIVMGSSKSKSWLRFASTTCLMSTELI